MPESSSKPQNFHASAIGRKEEQDKKNETCGKLELPADRSSLETLQRLQLVLLTITLAIFS